MLNSKLSFEHHTEFYCFVVFAIYNCNTFVFIIFLNYIDCSINWSCATIEIFHTEYSKIISNFILTSLFFNIRYNGRYGKEVLFNFSKKLLIVHVPFFVCSKFGNIFCESISSCEFFLLCFFLIETLCGNAIVFKKCGLKNLRFSYLEILSILLNSADLKIIILNHNFGISNRRFKKIERDLVQVVIRNLVHPYPTRKKRSHRLSRRTNSPLLQTRSRCRISSSFSPLSITGRRPALTERGWTSWRPISPGIFSENPLLWIFLPWSKVSRNGNGSAMIWRRLKTDSPRLDTTTLWLFDCLLTACRSPRNLPRC